jgi:hypothetical protein
MTQPQPAAGDVASAEPLKRGPGPGNEVKELWFALARRYWTSVVLVPASPDGSAADLARSLAEVGSLLRDRAVNTIVAEPLSYEAAARIAETVAATGQVSKAHPVATPIQVIVAIQPVIEEPLGVAVAHAADATVLCIEVGRTRLAEVRRTIDLIGQERIAGCFLLGR